VRVTVTCHASLAPAQPDPPAMELPGETAAVTDVLALLGVPAGADVVILLDGGPAWPDTPLSDGARLDLLPMVEGG
jgi:sulfur carrier protein ThiS